MGYKYARRVLACGLMKKVDDNGQATPIKSFMQAARTSATAPNAKRFLKAPLSNLYSAMQSLRNHQIDDNTKTDLLIADAGTIKGNYLDLGPEFQPQAQKQHLHSQPTIQEKTLQTN